MAAWITITLNDNGGSGSSPSVFYYHTTSPVAYYKTKSATSANLMRAMTTLPTKSGYTYGGHYSSNGVGYVYSNGNVTTGGPTTSNDFTIYARWTPNTYTLTFNAGTGGTVEPSTKTVTFDSAVGELPTPEKSGARFIGWFTDPDEGEQWTASTIYQLTENTTLYARWEEPHTLTLDATGGTVSPSSLSVFTGDAIGTLPTPEKTDYFFDGWFTDPDEGDPVEASTIYTWTTDKTIYARWTLDEQYFLAFDANGGSVSPASKIVKPGIPIGELPTPTKYANTFLGWYTDPTGGEQWTASTIYPLTENTTLYAHWEIDPEYSRTLIFDAGDGTVSPSSKTCTYGLTIGELPIPIRADKKFVGWFSTSSDSGGTQYTEDSFCDWTGSKTIYARWVDSMLGLVEDFFNLASTVLVPIASDSGDDRLHICCAHTGKTDVTATSAGVWRNPRVTYIIKADTTFNITLGRAFPARSGVSGYMIIAAEIRTLAGQFPTITVEAVANEGRDAINKWTVSVPLVNRSKAQNLLSAIQGGGKLNACTIRACCDPVVVAENMMPCASDVVEGRIELSATTIATANESEPTTTNGFTQIGAPKIGSDTYYTSYNLKARKEL